MVYTLPTGLLDRGGEAQKVTEYPEESSHDIIGKIDPGTSSERFLLTLQDKLVIFACNLQLIPGPGLVQGRIAAYMP